MRPDLDGLQKRLAEIVGPDQVKAGPSTAAYGVDGVTPALFVRPASEKDVSSVVKACAEAGAATIPWGGGTAMGLGNIPARGDVALALDRLNRIVEHDAENLTVTVEAGVRLADLQSELSKSGQFLPLDPPAEGVATIGGILAANSSGPCRLQYGTARDFVLGMRVVLADGEAIRCGGKVIKNVSGYDMPKLFIGSLGTLGVITQATFKLLPLPVVRATVCGDFAELGQAAGIVARALDSVLLPEAMEFLDSGSLGLLASATGGTEVVAGASGACPEDARGRASYGLAVALAGSLETVERQARDFTKLFQDAQSRNTTCLQNERSTATWRAIRNVFDLLPKSPAERTLCKIAVPISRTSEMLAAAEELGRRLCLRTAATAHAGSGIVQACYVTAPDSPPVESLAEGLAKLRQTAETAGGSLTLQAAPAALKSKLDAWGKPGHALVVMQRLKASFDPKGLFNPGRFLGGL